LPTINGAAKDSVIVPSPSSPTVISSAVPATHDTASVEDNTFDPLDAISREAVNPDSVNPVNVGLSPVPNPIVVATSAGEASSMIDKAVLVIVPSLITGLEYHPEFTNHSSTTDVLTTIPTFPSPDMEGQYHEVPEAGIEATVHDDPASKETYVPYDGTTSKITFPLLLIAHW
jgi:hypothetical protein